MNKLYILLLIVSLYSCSDKDNSIELPVHPPMVYTDLNDVKIKFGQFKALDINKDNTEDFAFSTLLVGDPVLRRDKRQYYANSSFDAFLLVDDIEQTPVLSQNDLIPINDHAGLHWYNASSIILTQKIIGENEPVHWEGNWQNVSHKFIPVQVKKNELRYNGWVEISFSTANEELTLHKAAIAVDAGVNVRAGR